ncbi:MAG: trypsin-like peptidase domain-containing protein [Gammaproteobacteria bacterium]|nr:trypsin-like peptidase domain-containing protein [Gammaproteobacteria bacterium]
MGRTRTLLLSILGLAFAWTANAALPPGLNQLANPVSLADTQSIGPFTDLVERIAEAEADPRAGMLVGLNRPAVFDLANVETEVLSNGNTLQRLAIQSPDALSTSLHFSAFDLAEGVQLWLYAPGSTEAHGPYTNTHANPIGEFWSPQVIGDTIVVEVESPAESRSNIQVAHINHGTKAWWQDEDSVQTKAAGSCHVNVACSTADGHSTKVRATARLIYSTLLQSFACSGTLINNSDQDGTPYFLTANHCISSNAGAASATTYWQYQSNSCGSNTPPNINQTISGATVVSTWATNDFTLLRLSAQPPAVYNPYWSGWDRSGADLGSGVAIHHPAGDVKKISLENDPMAIVNGSANPADATNALGLYVRVSRWDLGTTEGGSSGSGIWNPSNRLVGALSAGSADCNTPNGQDFYGWIGQGWEGGGTAQTRLKDWLAPNNTLIQTLDGCDHHGASCSAAGSSNTPIGTVGNDDSGGGGNGAWLLSLVALFWRFRKR